VRTQRSLVRLAFWLYVPSSQVLARRAARCEQRAEFLDSLRRVRQSSAPEAISPFPPGSTAMLEYPTQSDEPRTVEEAFSSTPSRPDVLPEYVGRKSSNSCNWGMTNHESQKKSAVIMGRGSGSYRCARIHRDSAKHHILQPVRSADLV